MLINRFKEWWLPRVSSESAVPIAAGSPTPASENTFAMVASPSWRHKLGQMLGYRYHHPDVDANEKAAIMPGWWRTDIHVRLSFLDRIRILVSGRMLVITQNRGSQSVDHVISDSAVSIISPFDENF